MKGMNCKRAAGLLPLYAAGDLDAARGGEVASHLAACEGCRRLAGEFSESRALLGEAFETPDFGAEFYSGIRSSVLERISRDREPSTPSLVAALFGRRLAYATTFAVALVALALAFQHFRGGARQTPRLAKDQQYVNAPQQDWLRESQATPQLNAGKNEPTPKPTYAATNQRRESTRRAATGQRRQGFTPKTVARDDEGAQIARVTPSSVNDPREAGAAASPAGGSPSSPSATAAAPEVSRIEIQTADPNIRIIWLAPRKSEAPDPNEPKNENGERK
jgi:hypothetical protein